MRARSSICPRQPQEWSGGRRPSSGQTTAKSPSAGSLPTAVHSFSPGRRVRAARSRAAEERGGLSGPYSAGATTTAQRGAVRRPVPHSPVLDLLVHRWRASRGVSAGTTKNSPQNATVARHPSARRRRNAGARPRGVVLTTGSGGDVEGDRDGRAAGRWTSRSSATAGSSAWSASSPRAFRRGCALRGHAGLLRRACARAPHRDPVGRAPPLPPVWTGDVARKLLSLALRASGRTRRYARGSRRSRGRCPGWEDNRSSPRSRRKDGSPRWCPWAFVQDPGAHRWGEGLSLQHPWGAAPPLAARVPLARGRDRLARLRDLAVAACVPGLGRPSRARAR